MDVSIILGASNWVARSRGGQRQPGRLSKTAGFSLLYFLNHSHCKTNSGILRENNFPSNNCSHSSLPGGQVDRSCSAHNAGRTNPAWVLSNGSLLDVIVIGNIWYCPTFWSFWACTISEELKTEISVYPSSMLNILPMKTSSISNDQSFFQIEIMLDLLSKGIKIYHKQTKCKYNN